MGRKKRRGFEWVADDVEGEVNERPERPSRAAEKQRRQQLERLAKRLAALPGSIRATLAVDDEVRDAINAVAQAGKGPDRRRALLRAKGMLAEEEPAILEALLQEYG